MKTIESEQLIGCDIDETLILWGPATSVKTVAFVDPYDGETKIVGVHEANVKVLVNHLARGSVVFVWSRSGYKWAKAALEALGIDHDNIYVSSKPIGYIDDKPCEQWMGEQIYLPVDSKWGL